MNIIDGLLTVGLPLVTDPDNPTDGNPDAMVIEGERLEADDVSVDDEVDDDDPDYEDDSDTPEADSDDDDDNQDTGNYRQRYGDSVRYGQQQKQRADALEARIQKLEREGINLAEIEALLPKDSSVQAPDPNAQFARKQDLAQMAQSIQWNMARTSFLSSNPEFREDANLGSMLEFQTAKIIQDNVRKMGTLTLTPDKVYKSASKQVKALVNSFESKGKKKASQTRKKIKSQSADMGGDTGKRSGKTDDKDENETFDPRASYMNFSKL